jgi:signal transduction histidine kinase
VTITTVGTVWLATDQIEELSAAVRQALENVAQHAGASRASLFADQDGSEIVVSVRDDGKGFDYDEAVLRDAGKMGVFKSMKGRIEDLGGVMQIHSGPGAGTEVEFRIPAEAKAPR